MNHSSKLICQFVVIMVHRVCITTFHNNICLCVYIRYYNGNDTDKGQIRGFGHIGFLVDDLHGACDSLEQAGVSFKKKPNEGNMKQIAFAYDPDHYW